MKAFIDILPNYNRPLPSNEKECDLRLKEYNLSRIYVLQSLL